MAEMRQRRSSELIKSYALTCAVLRTIRGINCEEKYNRQTLGHLSKHRLLGQKNIKNHTA